MFKKIKILCISLLFTGCVSVGIGTSFPIGNIDFGIGATKEIGKEEKNKKEIKEDKKEIKDTKSEKNQEDVKKN